MTADGWFKTGDIGRIDEQGFLKITDRKKDLLKTSGGKYIAPSAIESRFKAICPIAAQMVVHADRRNYATALVTLDPDTLVQWAESNEVEGDYTAMAANERTRAYVGQCIEELNASLNRWETVKDFRVLDHDFSVETGELTPTLKVKRKACTQKYLAQLDAMYDEKRL